MNTAYLLIAIFVNIINIVPIRSDPKIVCYYTNWSVYRPGTAKFNPQNINPYLCTHLIYAFGGFTKDNQLKPFDKYQDIEQGGYAKFTGLKTYNKDLKTMLAIGGWNEGSSRFSPLVASAERRGQLVKNTIKYLRQNKFDGLDLDWEYPAFRDGGKSRDRDNYAKLVQELREEFDRENQKTGRPRLLLTMAVPAGFEYIDNGYDIPKLNKYLDWFNLLSYDYHSAYEPATNHHAPLYPLEEENEYSFDTDLNINSTITKYVSAGADREKLVLGIPTYGRSYTLFNEDSTDIGAPADGPGDQGDATREKGYLAYYEICQGINEEDSEWEVVQPNPNLLGPYAVHGNQWVGYDDEGIVRKKAKFVVDQKLGGIMFWSIDNDDFRGLCGGKPYPLIEAAKEALLSGNQGQGSVNSNRVNNNKNERTTTPANKRKPNKPQTTTERESNNVYKKTTPEPPTTPDPGSDFKCEEEGFFEHPRDCKKYFWCLDGGASGLGLVPHQFTCPSGLFFNKDADSCDYSRNVQCATKAAAASPKTTTESTPKITSPRTTERSTVSTTPGAPYKNPFFSRTTSTSTSTAAPIEEEEESEEKPSSFSELDQEDPKVIKELIDLIKKVGGLEELEKQLNFQSDGSVSIKNSKTSQVSTTPPSISKSLFEKVLIRSTALKLRSNGASQAIIPKQAVTKETTAFKPETKTSTTPGTNKYASLSRKSNTRPQTAEVESTTSAASDNLSKKPEYQTIKRRKPAVIEENDYNSEEEAVTKSSSKVEEKGSKSKYSQYASIQRSKKTSTAPKYDDEEDEDDVDNSDTTLKTVRNEFTTRSTPQYVNLSRRRTTASPINDDVDDDDTTVASRYVTKEQTVTKPSTTPTTTKAAATTTKSQKFANNDEKNQPRTTTSRTTKLVAPLIYKDSTKLLERNSFIQINTTVPTNTLNQTLTIRNKTFPKIISPTTTTTTTTTTTNNPSPTIDNDVDSTTLRPLDLASDEDNLLSEPTEPVTEIIPLTESSLPIVKPTTTTTTIQFQSTRKQVQSIENKQFKKPFNNLLQSQQQSSSSQSQSNLIDENDNSVHNSIKLNPIFGSTIDNNNVNNDNTDFKPRPFSIKTRLPSKRVPNVTSKRNTSTQDPNDNKVSEVDQEARFSKRRNSVLSPSEVETILSTTNRPIAEYTPGYRGSVRYRTTTISSLRYDPNNSLRSQSNDNDIVRTRVSTERTQSPLTSSTTQRTRSPVSLTSSATQRTTSRVRPTFTSKPSTTTTTTAKSILSIIPEASDRFNLDLSEADKRPDRLRFELKLGRKIDFGFTSLKPKDDETNDKPNDPSKVRILTGPLDKSPISENFKKGYVEEIPLVISTTTSKSFPKFGTTTVKPFSNPSESPFVKSVLESIELDTRRASRLKIQNQNGDTGVNSTVIINKPNLQLSAPSFKTSSSPTTTTTTTTTTTLRTLVSQTRLRPSKAGFKQRDNIELDSNTQRYNDDDDEFNETTNNYDNDVTEKPTTVSSRRKIVSKKVVKRVKPLTDDSLDNGTNTPNLSLPNINNNLKRPTPFTLQQKPLDSLNSNEVTSTSTSPSTRRQLFRTSPAANDIDTTIEQDYEDETSSRPTRKPFSRPSTTSRSSESTISLNEQINDLAQQKPSTSLRPTRRQFSRPSSRNNFESEDQNNEEINDDDQQTSRFPIASNLVTRASTTVRPTRRQFNRPSTANSAETSSNFDEEQEVSKPLTFTTSSRATRKPFFTTRASRVESAIDLDEEVVDEALVSSKPTRRQFSRPSTASRAETSSNTAEEQEVSKPTFSTSSRATRKPFFTTRASTSESSNELDEENEEEALTSPASKPTRRQFSRPSTASSAETSSTLDTLEEEDETSKPLTFTTSSRATRKPFFTTRASTSESANELEEENEEEALTSSAVKPTRRQFSRPSTAFTSETSSNAEEEQDVSKPLTFSTSSRPSRRPFFTTKASKEESANDVEEEENDEPLTFSTSSRPSRRPFTRTTNGLNVNNDEEDQKTSSGFKPTRKSFFKASTASDEDSVNSGDGEVELEQQKNSLSKNANLFSRKPFFKPSLSGDSASNVQVDEDTEEKPFFTRPRPFIKQNEEVNVSENRTVFTPAVPKFQPKKSIESSDESIENPLDDNFVSETTEKLLYTLNGADEEENSEDVKTEEKKVIKKRIKVFKQRKVTGSTDEVTPTTEESVKPQSNVSRRKKIIRRPVKKVVEETDEETTIPAIINEAEEEIKEEIKEEIVETTTKKRRVVKVSRRKPTTTESQTIALETTSEQISTSSAVTTERNDAANKRKVIKVLRKPFVSKVNDESLESKLSASLSKTTTPSRQNFIRKYEPNAAVNLNNQNNNNNLDEKVTSRFTPSLSDDVDEDDRDDDRNDDIDDNRNSNRSGNRYNNRDYGSDYRNDNGNDSRIVNRNNDNRNDDNRNNDNKNDNRNDEDDQNNNENNDDNQEEDEPIKEIKPILRFPTRPSANAYTGQRNRVVTIKRRPSFNDIAKTTTIHPASTSRSFGNANNNAPTKARQVTIRRKYKPTSSSGASSTTVDLLQDIDKASLSERNKNIFKSYKKGFSKPTLSPQNTFTPSQDTDLLTTDYDEVTDVTDTNNILQKEYQGSRVSKNNSTTTTLKPTTLHHIFAIDYEDELKKKLSSNITKGVESAADEVIKKLVKLIEINRVSEVYSKEEKFNVLKNKKLKSINSSDLILERASSVDKFSEISRLTLVKLVKKNITTTTVEPSTAVRNSKNLLFPGVETSTIELEGLFDREKKSQEPENTTPLNNLSLLLRPESNETNTNKAEPPLVISIANLDQVILTKTQKDLELLGSTPLQSVQNVVSNVDIPTTTEDDKTETTIE